MNIETISHTPDEYSRELTGQHYRTLYYLAVNGYITAEAYYELIETTFVSAVKNDKKLADRLLERLFKKNSTPNSYTFPIVNFKDDPNYKEYTGNDNKPNLRLVKDE